MMNDFYDLFFFGPCHGKNAAKDGVIRKKWGALNIFYRLLDLVRGRFVYELPDTMDDRSLELNMIYSGKSAIFQKDGEILNAEVQSGNSWSRYGYLNNCTLVDFMGRSYGRFIPNLPGNVMPDCAIVFDNKYNVPPISRIKWYADRLATIQGSINSCIANLRGSTIISCSIEQKKPIENAYRNAADGMPVILSFDQHEGGLQAGPQILTNPQTPDILKALQETHDKTMAEFLTEFGINANGIINKLSGISDEELKQNVQMTEIAFNQAYKSRQEGLEKASEMFGVEMKVKPNFDAFDTLTSEPKEDTMVEDEGGDDDVQVQD